MKQHTVVSLDAGEANLLRILLHCLKFGFEDAKFEYHQYITSPYFATMFCKVDDYMTSTLQAGREERLEFNKRDETIEEVTPAVQKIIDDIEDWRELPDVEHKRIITELFYPYVPTDEYIDKMIADRNG